MERLLSHYVPNITFDIQSLRQAAEELKSKHRDSESDAISTMEDPNELEDLAIDDEHFTIKAMPDNTTRMLSPRYALWAGQNPESDIWQNIPVNFHISISL